MSTYIYFDDLPLGDDVSNQLADDGVTFTAPLGRVVASSVSVEHSQALQGTRDGGPVEFPNWRIRGTFTSSTHSRISVTASSGVDLIVFDANKTQIGSVRVDNGSPFSETFGFAEFATGAANIAAFELHEETDHSFTVQSIVFDTESHHQPDFRFMVTDVREPQFVGDRGFLQIKVARLYGSVGPIDLEVGFNPPGLFTAGPLPSPITGGDGSVFQIPLQFTAMPINFGNSIMITGKPSSPSAGFTPRSVSQFVSPGLNPPPGQ
jgi:hypothetical protein